MSASSTASLDELLTSVGACPACGAALRKDAGAWCCAAGCARYDVAGGQPDLRLRAPKSVALPLVVGGSESAPRLRDEIPRGVNPPGAALPRHLPAALAAWIPPATNSGAVAVDVGCGSAANRGVLEASGYAYLGGDIADPAAPLLADAHALPMKDASVEFAISLAVLEHVDHPALVAREVHRVLKPGAVFLGTVAFLEPYHSQSKLHHSHLGTQRVLEAGGFEVDWVAPMPAWGVVEAQLSNALFPGLPKSAARRAGRAVDRARGVWFELQRVRGRVIPPTTRRAAVAGAFAFCARRPAEARG